MGELSLRLGNWGTRARKDIRRNWWVFFLVVLLHFGQELLKERLEHGTNEFIDTHARGWLITIKPELLYLLERPITSTVILSTLVILGLITHAYFETRRPLSVPRTTTDVGRLDSLSEGKETIVGSARPEGTPAALKQDEPRISVGKEVTPQFLLDLYKNNTSAQAGKLAEIYVGKWIHVSGIVKDVQKLDLGKGDYAMVHLYVPGSQSNKRAVTAILLFRTQWSERALMLPSGARVKVVGQIKETSWKWLDLENCEFE